jgi:hypothetical protein
MLQVTEKKARRMEMWFVILLVVVAAGCRETAPSRPDGGGDRTEFSKETNDVEEIRILDSGDVVWNGERVDTNTLAARLEQSRLDGDAIALYGKVTGQDARSRDQRVFESVARTGVRMVVVEDDGSARLSFQQTDGGKQPVTVSTMHVRGALKLYDRIKGEPPSANLLSGPDVVLRFDPDNKEGYVLKRVEVGVAGSSLWIVHEALDDSDSSTSIQYKKRW